MPHYRPRTKGAHEVEYRTRADLVKMVTDEMARWFIEVQDADIQVVYPGYGAPQHFVLMKNKQTKDGHWFFGQRMGPDFFGVIGYTDAPT